MLDTNKRASIRSPIKRKTRLAPIADSIESFESCTEDTRVQKQSADQQLSEDLHPLRCTDQGSTVLPPNVQLYREQFIGAALRCTNDRASEIISQNDRRKSQTNKKNIMYSSKTIKISNQSNNHSLLPSIQVTSNNHWKYNFLMSPSDCQ